MVNSNEDWSDWQDLLDAFETPPADDLIRKCPSIDLKDIVIDADKYFSLADSKLHVFPFQDVEICWHRLYTDTSIIKAIKIIRHAEDVGIDEKCNKWIDDAVYALDMAMIMAGGLGRAELVTDLLGYLEEKATELDVDGHRSKRMKTLEQLSTTEHSIPSLLHPVRERLDRPTLHVFENNIQQVKEPILLTGVVDDWPASKRWMSVKYWKEATIGGRRLVPIEVGRSYVDDDWKQEIVPFHQFLDEYILNQGGPTAYLAQFDLFNHLPNLNADIAVPDYCYADAPQPDPETPVAKAWMKPDLKSPRLADGEVQKNIWFGPAWTISPLHHDPYHNILCQIVGKKYVRLYDVRYSAKLYPRASNEPAPHGQGTIDMSNTSKLDIAAMELSPAEDWEDQWPGIHSVPYQEVILEPGQALYIPVGWWHYVRSCSVGISASFWWS